MFKIFLHILNIYLIFGFKPKQNQLSTTKAFTEVIFELFDHRNVTNLDIIDFEKKYFQNKLIKNIFENHKGTFRAIRSNKEQILNITSSSVVFVDSIKSLKTFLNISYFSNPANLNLLIFIKDFKKELKMSEIPIRAVPSGHVGEPIQFSYFLIEEENQILLKTIEWWTPKKCGEAQFVTLNSFNKKKMKWSQNPLKIPEKYTNFHNCAILHHTTFFSSPSLELIISMGELAKMFHENIPVVLETRESVEIKVREIFAKIGNFTSVGGIQEAYLATICQYLNWVDETECSIATVQNPYVAMHSPPDPYSNYEKMLMPFDKIVWIGLSLTFLLSCVTVLGINRLPSRHKLYFYSKNEKSPMFNILTILFGNAQTHLPDENLGRIILITFVFFCLVVRTAYQGL
jgi:hypothetical protein